MKIWLITIGEPLPTIKNKLRLQRTGIIAKHITEHTNHEVVWWTSAFSHFTKKHIYNSTETIKLRPNYELVALHGKGYSKNISINRIIDHNQIAQQFINLAINKETPDIIVVAFPTLGLCKRALSYGKRNNIPVVIDYRDMWPEVFTDLLPVKMQPLGKIILSPLFKKTKSVFEKANGLIGITEPFLASALKKADREKKDTDGVFPLAYLLSQSSDTEYQKAKKFWSKLKVSKDSSVFRICFFGSFGYQIDLDPIIDAVAELEENNIPIQVILCGIGDKLEYIKKKSTGLKSVILPGFMNAAQIRALMDLSDIGLVPFYPKEAYLNSIPGKAIEYLSAGIPLLSSLGEGILGKLIQNNNLGYNYDHKDSKGLVSILKTLISKETNRLLQQKDIFDFYLNNFDSEKVYSSYVKHLESVEKNYK